ncbi:MAG: hypothetical protein WC544_04315 [Patescibacteria group bacterium]
MKKSIYIFIAVVIFIAAGAVALVFLQKKELSGPPTITANFIDPSKVDRISKFRSCQGHVVVPQDGSETKRNMKHYLMIQEAYQGKQVEVYAPYDSTVSIRELSNQDLEGEISFAVNGSDWSMSILHLVVLDTLKNGDEVKAGDLVGHIPDKGIDLVYSAGGEGVKMIDGWESPYGALDSVFNHMSDAAFSQWLGDNVRDRSDLIYTKEFRDANPCQLETSSNAQDAQLNDHDHPEDWVTIQ